MSADENLVVPVFEPFRKIARLSRPICVTEKIDGSNAQVCIVAVPDTATPPIGSIARVVNPVAQMTYHLFAGSRSRWLFPGKATDNFGFAEWVADHASELVALGEGRHYGEWWGPGINRGYEQAERRFSLFNVSRWREEAPPACCHVVPVLYDGEFTTDAVDGVLNYLQKHGSVASPGFMRPEGVIIFHVSGNIFFKKTLIGDEAPKSTREAA